MERAACCADQRPVAERFDLLTEVFRCLQAGSCPVRSTAEVSAVVLSCVCGLPSAPVGYSRGSSEELTCIGLTTVGKIASTFTEQNLSLEVSLYFEEALRLLFEEMDLMSHLSNINCDLLYVLTSQGVVSPVWEQRCLQAFHSSAPSPELVACLWSLTEVLKRLIRGLLGKLLAAFDCSLSVLCSKLLPGVGNKALLHVVDFTGSSEWGTAFCLLMDLLEGLTASTLICEAGVCLQSQRLTHIHASALLKMISFSSECFVKKRVLLLLKRAVLQKTGEDWALGDMPFTALRHDHFNADMSVLAESVLTAVAANWLDSVHVDSASFFGGTRHMCGNDTQKSDSVMLRAISLCLLKSMELHVQIAMLIPVCLLTERILWGFLRRHNVQLKEATHLCCWVNLLFGEQDDDMMEASKALLSIFLHHRYNKYTDPRAACASGCNPHCHFLFLLQSISFDHSILLDFLISTETCFLEYFVRYLKFLRTECQGFSAVCVRTGTLVFHLQKLLASSCNMDSQNEHGDVRGPLPIRQSHFGSSYSSGLLTQPTSSLERPEGLSILVLQSMQTSRPNMATLSGHVTCEASARAVGCLSELREVVTRLQAKGLFPYNPSSLLKLLAKVENCSQHTHLSHFNK
uniref:Uncharacterized protein n=1 Tax=Mola mola TaxID=94237 RepID=A0A3Q3XCR5_MOLML